MELYISVKVDGIRYKTRKTISENKVPKGFPEKLAFVKTIIMALSSDIYKLMKEGAKA